MSDTLYGEMGDDEQPTVRGGGNGDGQIKIGEVLKRARNERGLSLEEVEQATKIRKRYLDGLEREDYSVLPDAVYVQGFLKTYANYLGLDGEELSQELKRRHGVRQDRKGGGQPPPSSGFERPLISPGGLAEAERRAVSPAALMTLAAVVVAVAAVIGALYYVGKGAQQPAPPGEPPDAPAAGEPAGRDAAGDTGGRQEAGRDAAGDTGGRQEPEGTAPEERTSPPPPPEPDMLRVSVDVHGAPSWLSIQADGSVVFEALARPGFSETFQANRALSIHTGNAGAVQVEVNGQDLGLLGGDGEVLVREFTRKEAS